MKRNLPYVINIRIIFKKFYSKNLTFLRKQHRAIRTNY